MSIAGDSIRHGIAHGQPLHPDVSKLPPPLQELKASFVTLRLETTLRGCIGTLNACEPLALDVARNAFNAAFRDPRFPPVTSPELDRLEIHISILSPPEPLAILDEDDLLQLLRPGVDGLILIEGRHRATYLPSVWEQLPDPADFVRELKLKAGLPAGYWSSEIRVERYTCEHVP